MDYNEILENQEFYGKKFKNMSKTEQLLLKIDIMLSTSFEFKMMGVEDTLFGITLGGESMCRFLTDTKFILLHSLLNVPDDVDVLDFSDNTIYSFDVFLKNFAEAKLKIMKKDIVDTLFNICEN